MNMCTERFPKGKNKNNIVFVSGFLLKLLFIAYVHCQWGDFSEHEHLQCDVIENPVMQTPQRPVYLLVVSFYTKTKKSGTKRK